MGRNPKAFTPVSYNLGHLRREIEYVKRRSGRMRMTRRHGHQEKDEALKRLIKNGTAVHPPVSYNLRGRRRDIDCVGDILAIQDQQSREESPCGGMKRQRREYNLRPRHRGVDCVGDLLAIQDQQSREESPRGRMKRQHGDQGQYNLRPRHRTSIVSLISERFGSAIEGGKPMWRDETPTTRV